MKTKTMYYHIELSDCFNYWWITHESCLLC